MTRNQFLAGSLSAFFFSASSRLCGQSHAPTENAALDLRQREIDAVTPEVFKEYVGCGLSFSDRGLLRRYPALQRLEDAFEKVMREVKETRVGEKDRPAVWYLYNMGIVVKTPRCLFSIDLHHRRAEEFAPLLDFALVTHRHSDHSTPAFLQAMDQRERKCVVSNFFANSGVRAPQPCGLTQEWTRTFTFGDVTVRTGLCDHNSRLVDFTTAFDVQVGDFTLFHSGDCSGPEKFALARPPDLWIFHPFCSMDCVAAARTVVRPKKAVIAHLQELGHAKGVWRWTYRDGLDEKKRFAGAGFRSQMPLWGERIV